MGPELRGVHDMATINGTPGDDSITGTSAADTIYAGAGNDTIYDNDAYSDLVYGGAGDDTWIPSTNQSASGSDRVYLEAGNDTAYLGWLTRGQNETIDGGSGVDTFNFSNFPNNAINVTILSNGTLDFGGTLVEENKYYNFENVVGNAQKNILIGNQEANLLDGGNGDDTLDGKGGDDSLIGGQGRDSILGGDGNDVIDGGNDEDKIDGGAGNDLIYGGQGQDTVSGGSGDDTVYGGDGDDKVYGDDGNDTLFGGQGQDYLYGGKGDDILRGADGPGQDNDDRLYGGDGNDTLYGEDVQDSLYGGFGNDTFIIDKDGNIGTITVVGGEDPDNGDFDVLDLKTGLLNGDYASVTILPGANSEAGLAELRDIHGNIIGRVNFSEIEKVIVCFTPDTVIATPKGERMIGDLRAGDKVFTRDNGIQEIRWIGQRDLSAADLAQTPAWEPVLVQAGSLGNGLPERDLLLSPQHRLLLTGQRAALYFDETEVFAAAKHMTHLDGISRVTASTGVRYVHLMFDRHEVILSNGAWTESFQPGDYSLKGLGKAQRREILSLFPDLVSVTGEVEFEAARKTLKKHEAQLLSS